MYKIPENIPSCIFRAYDIRGVAGEGLTSDIVYTLALAIGSEAHERNQKRLAIARDGRLSGPELFEALTQGLLDSGREVIDIGMVPTPLLYFATQWLKTQSGVMLTGSHNPAEYNGLKIVLQNNTLAEQDILALKERAQLRHFHYGQGRKRQVVIIDDYIGHITADIKLNRSLKLVVDCGNGVTGVVAPQLFKAMGCEVIELFCEVDGRFPHHHPDPSVTTNLETIIASVKEQKADIGLAFDGDGDRLGVVTDQGEIIWPDRQMMLFSQDLLSRSPGAEIIFDVKCSKHLPTVIAKAGGKPIMWKTGHSLLKAKMQERRALLAGEMSGHIFFKERWYGFDDGIYAAARLLEILAKDNRAVSKVFHDLPDSINTPELKIAVGEERKFELMEKLLAQAHFENAQINTIDGLRVDFADGWGLVRLSNTTPCLTLRFEADDKTALQRIQNLFRQQLLSVDNSLDLPF